MVIYNDIPIRRGTQNLIVHNIGFMQNYQVMKYTKLGCDKNGY